MKIETTDTFLRSLRRYSGLRRKLRDIYYKIKGFLWSRHTTIKSRHLPHTWVDRSQVLPYTMMQILEDFLTKECGEGCWVDWTDHVAVLPDGREVHVMTELNHIMDWFNQVYLKKIEHTHDRWYEYVEHHQTSSILNLSEPDEHGNCEMLPTEYDVPDGTEVADKLFKRAEGKEKGLDKHLTENLIMLVKLRESLWT